MQQISIRKYTADKRHEWNQFVGNANNATFLFYREYMEYHQDRFQDFSLMIFQDEKLIAVFPANVLQNKIYSHSGLSYGGIVVKETLTISKHIEITKQILKFYHHIGIKEIEIKLLPTFYYKKQNTEINYILFLLQAQLIRKDAYYAFLNKEFNINRNRKRALIKNSCLAFELREDDENYEDFWEKILSPNLQNRFQVKPVHTHDEILKLKQLFPENIKLYTVYLNGEIQAGAVLYITNEVVHFQYSSGIENRENGALDFLFYKIIEKYLHRNYISFGNSSEVNGKKLNKGLLLWKKSFGASMYNQDYYLIHTAKYNLLDNIFV